MAKRKRQSCEVGNAGRKSKRYSSDFSEAATDCEGTVEEPCPKYPVKTNRYLTFPMGTNSKPLPDSVGPKLGPFSHGDVQVRFIRELGDNAVHSNVFEVEINGKLYALKIFRTFSSGYFPQLTCWPEDARPTAKEMGDYFRPFFRECRAYSRINDNGISHRYWRAYGYLKLPAELRDRLCRLTGLPPHHWQVRPPKPGRPDIVSWTRPAELHWPLYAIVKELASAANTNLIDHKRRSIRTMAADLKRLHKIGVVNHDVADRNYVGGRIVDFSSSFTIPNIWMNRLDGVRSILFPDTLERGAWADMRGFRDMIRQSGVRTKYLPPRETLDGGPFVRTRKRRVDYLKWHKLHPLPFYELGVNEPSERRHRSFSVFSLVDDSAQFVPG